MAIEKKQEYSQIGLTKQRSIQTYDDELCSLVPSFNGAVIVEEETLGPKKKKQRLGSSWWDDVDAFNELGSVVKGLSKSTDAASNVGSSFYSAKNLHETKKKKKKKKKRKKKKKKEERLLSSSSHHGNFIDLCEDESYSDSNNMEENQDRVGYGHVSLEDLGVSMEDPWLGCYVNDIISSLDPCFSSSPSTYLLETETNTTKDDDRSLSSSHNDNFIDLIEVGESSTSSNKGNRHKSLEDFGVTVEDLKSMPWEAFDPTWEIRSETMDPWLGG